MRGRWTDKRALAATQRRIAKIEQLCIEIAGLWADEDEYIIQQADHLRDHAREVWDEARESTEVRQQERAQREADDAERRA